MKTNFQYYLLALSIIFANHIDLHSAARITSTEDNKDISYQLGCELIESAINGDNKKIEELIKQGVDINFQNSKGETALVVATEKGRRRTVELLIKLGADVNSICHFPEDDNPVYQSDSPNCHGTALMEAANMGYKSIVELLIKNKADVNIGDYYSETALFHALYHTNPKKAFEISKLLIDSGANVNVQNSFSDNALWRLTSALYEEVDIVVDFDLIRLLIYSGIDVESEGVDETPLYHAIKASRKDLVYLLLLNAADYLKPHRSQDGTSYKPLLDIARENNNEEIIKLLTQEPSRRESEINKWKALVANKITSATGNQLVNNISKIISEYTIDTYKDVVKLEKEDEKNKCQALITSNISKATGNQLNKDISKIVSEYVIGSNSDVVELEKIEKDNNSKNTVTEKQTSDSGKNIVETLLKSSEEFEKNKLKRKLEDSEQDSDLSKKIKLSASAIKAQIISLNEKLRQLNTEMTELLNSYIGNYDKIEQKQVEIDAANLQIKLLIESLKNAKS